MKLSRTDDLRISSAIQRTMMGEPGLIVTVMKFGTSIIHLLDRKYRQASQMKLEILLNEIIYLRNVG